MREKISKLAKGIFEQERLELEISISSIQDATQEKEALCGSFFISSYPKKEIKGVLYPGSSRVKLNQIEFSGVEIEIEYEIYCFGIIPGELLKGEIQIVSSAGEASIPYEIQVEAPYMRTSMGKIRNLFHFTNLVKKDGEEALKLFYSPEFPEIFLSNTPKVRATYESLIKGISPKTALEEFLVFVNKKARVSISLEEEQKEFSDFEKTEGDSICLHKDNWGYIEIDVSAENTFIQLNKKRITSEEFAGNVYEYQYLIDEKTIHIGWNYGKILFHTPYQILEYEIIVHKKKTRERRSDLQQRLRYGIADLSEEYFSFRLHKINTDMWCKQSLKILGQMAEEDEMPLFLKLLKVQLYITQKRSREAGWILQEIEKHFKHSSGSDIFLYCYYLYVNILYLRDREKTKEAAQKVWEFYNNGNDDWRILWVLLYLDEEAMLNKSLRLTRIKEKFKNGCRSPFLYYEACIALNEQPELLRVLNEFELQCLWWGMKHYMLQEKTVLQIVELTALEKKYDVILIKILGSAYGKYHNKQILEGLLSLLLRNGVISEKYFKWFEKGVEKDIKITGLYEAYMNTLPENYADELPKVITMYFAFDNSLNEKRRAILYANILRYSKENQVLIKNYKTIMERFALSQIEKERIDKDLAILYRKVISKSLIDVQIAKKYPAIVLTKRLLMMDNHMKFAVIRHKELEEEWKVPIINGEAYFPIYTEDYGLVFEDSTGRRFAENIEYSMKDLFREEGILKYCYEIEEGYPLLWLHLCEREGLHKREESMIQYYQPVANSKEIKPSYKNQILQKLIEYYSENYNAELLEAYLKKLDKDMMKSEEQRKITELFLVRSMYTDAQEMISRIGYNGISATRILKFCFYFLWTEEEQEENSFLLEMCQYVYEKGKYNETILQYLLEFAKANSQNLFELWRTAKDFEVDTSKLEERFIRQMLFTDTYVVDAIYIFEHYYRYHTNEEEVRAYLARQSYLYFVLDTVISEKIFEIIERELRNNQEVLDISKFALLKYYVEDTQKKWTDEQKKWIESLLKEFVKKEKVFQFYKEFENRQKLPPILRDKTILEYHTEPELNVSIHYMLEAVKEEKTYEIGTMKEVYDGIYNKQFILFYGENLQYYITQEKEGQENITESDSILISNWNSSYGESRYHLLNDICASLDIGDNKTILELYKTYAEKQIFIEEYFKPIE